jgi:hypothetical protein
MKFSTLISLAAAILPVLSAPSDILKIKEYSVMAVSAQLESLAENIARTDLATLRRRGSDLNYLEKSALPDGCERGLSTRSRSGSAARIKELIKQYNDSKIKNKVAPCGDGWEESCYFTFQKYGTNGITYVAMSWRDGTAQPKPTYGQVASALDRIIKSCGQYSALGTVSANLWLPEIAGQPSLSIGGRENWTG